jgi:hypothetical protein
MGQTLPSDYVGCTTASPQSADIQNTAGSSRPRDFIIATKQKGSAPSSATTVVNQQIPGIEQMPAMTYERACKNGAKKSEKRVCGRSSVVERQLPKLYVASSILAARSNLTVSSWR